MSVGYIDCQQRASRGILTGSDRKSDCLGLAIVLSKAAASAGYFGFLSAIFCADDSQCLWFFGRILGSCIAMCGKLFTNLFPFLDISLTTNEIKGDDVTAIVCFSIGELSECGMANLARLANIDLDSIDLHQTLQMCARDHKSPPFKISI